MHAAVIIGCGPGLYREAKVVSSSRQNYYGGNQYHRHDGPYPLGSGSRNKSAAGGPDIKLHSYPRAVVNINNEGSSQEDLVTGKDKIMVTRSVTVRDHDNLGRAV